MKQHQTNDTQRGDAYQQSSLRQQQPPRQYAQTQAQYSQQQLQQQYYQQQRSAQQQRPYGQQQAYQNQLGAQQPASDPEDNQRKANKAKKKQAQNNQNAPVTKKQAFFMGLLASLIIFFICGGILILYSASADNKVTDEQAAILEKMEEQYDKQSTLVNITPSEQAVNKALSSNANIQVAVSSGDTVETRTGAGVVLSSDGYIMTNAHVIDSAKSISVTIGENEYSGELKGTDPTSDIAVIKIDAKNLTPITPSESSIRVGTFLMAVGNPYGLADSLSIGYVSALNRDMTYSSGNIDIMYAGMIQMAMNINPGNSGGGVYNEAGEFVGMATAIASSDGTNTGISYAIPSKYALEIAESLANGKEAAHAVLGLSLSDVPEDQIVKYGLSTTNGAYITAITASGPGEIAGLSKDDIIIKFDGKSIKDANDLLFKVRVSDIGSEHELTILRQGKEMPITINLGSDV